MSRSRLSRTPLSRRSVLQASAAAALLPAARFLSAEETPEVAVRAVTRGPRFHWFAYYDKLQFDGENRRVLGMEVDFEHRSPGPQDRVRLGMADLHDGDRWTVFGESTAWCWQQGCMLQWRPGHDGQVLWNDRSGEGYVCRIHDFTAGQTRTLPAPIYAVAPDGRWAVNADFRRINDLRPGYGYAGIPDPYAEERAPKASGIERVDLETGATARIVSIADAAAIPFEHGDFGKGKHWFNHLLINPDGSRLVFLHRWKTDARRRLTRMLSVRPDGGDLRVLIGSGYVSHFIWRDPRHVLAYAKPSPDAAWGFFLFEDRPGGAVEQIGPGVMGPGDGHCTYLPGNQWILCDSYPDRDRMQHLYLFRVADGKRIPLGKFRSPPEYAGEWRCDLHPRFSRDGRLVTIDSTHENGRQIYLLDISRIVETASA